MGALLDWLSTHVEPYVSFRWLLGGVLSALALQSLLATFFTLRDLARPGAPLPPREQQLARLLKSHGVLLLLRALSWRTVRRYRGLVVQIVLLTIAAVVLHAWVFAWSDAAAQ